MTTSYVTTSIPYVNAEPHVGFALECVIADAIVRWRRKRGHDVRFLTGTDDNGLKSVHAAERERLPVATLVAKHAAQFEQLTVALDLSTDDFIRTSSDERHRRGVARLWRACAASGDVYKAGYSGRYCVGCERFVDEVERRCPEHDAPLEDVVEENWFFRLSRYESRLVELIESGRLQVVPQSRHNEVLSFVRSGLRDFSISRSAHRARGWGIVVPDDPTQVVYVWFDALGNYVTALDEPGLERYWRHGRVTHVIGKDIVRFHAVYWPAILLSAGLPVPDEVVSHGFLTVDGRKISKSSGNVVDPFALIGEFGVDAVRYFLLRHIRTTEDGDFRLERLIAARDADLADQLGNLVSRVTSMVERYSGGTVPEAEPAGPLSTAVRTLPKAVDDACDRFEVHVALEEIWRVIEAANRYVVETAPWVLARTADVRLGPVLGVLCAALRGVGEELAPFLPQTSAEILARVPDPGRTARSGPSLFPKS